MRGKDFFYGLLLCPLAVWGQREGKVYYVRVDRAIDQVEYEARPHASGDKTSYHWKFVRQPEDNWEISLFTFPIKPPFIATEVVKKPLAFLDTISCCDRAWMQGQTELKRLFPDRVRLDDVAAFRISMEKHEYQKDGSINVNHWPGESARRNPNRVFVADEACIEGDSITLYEVLAEIRPIRKRQPVYILLDRHSPHITYRSNEGDSNAMSSAYRCWDFYRTDTQTNDSVLCYLYQPDPQRLGVKGDWLIERKPLTFLDSVECRNESFLLHGWEVFTSIPVKWEDQRPRGYVLDRATICNDSIVMYEVVLSGRNNGDDFYEGYEFGMDFCE